MILLSERKRIELIVVQQNKTLSKLQIPLGLRHVPLFAIISHTLSVYSVLHRGDIKMSKTWSCPSGADRVLSAMNIEGTGAADFQVLCEQTVPPCPRPQAPKYKVKGETSSQSFS